MAGSFNEPPKKTGENKNYMDENETQLIKTMVLDNHLTVNLMDQSRKISEDAYLVVMVAQMDIPIEKSLLMDTTLAEVAFEKIVDKLGDKVQFEHRVERNFIMAKDKDTVLQHLVDTFTDNMISYLSKESFPGKFIVKQYNDK